MILSRIHRASILSAFLITLAAGTALTQTKAKKPASKPPAKAPAAHAKTAPTVSEAQAFMAKAEEQLFDLGVRAGRANWVQENFITDDTETMAAQANERATAVSTQLALDARRFDGMKLPPELARKFLLLKLSLIAPAPNNDAQRKELTELATKMDGMFGKGKYCKTPAGGGKEKCLSLNDLSRILASSTNPDELLDAWVGWHKISVPMKDKYARFVELSNQGAKELGFKDTGAMWRSNYDMTPEQFSAEVERLWRQVEPFYISLHTYVRKQLIKKYGKVAERPDGMIPAHLLGNMWAQEWGNVYPLVAPAGGGQGYDLTQLLKDHKVDELGMVRYGENFFKSLGFAELPKTFWERSLFLKPQDRDVVCHPSAWDVDSKEDLRLKMCIEIKDEDFVTIHHELGHNFYQRAYKDQPNMFQDSANDGFHEAVGDTIALSVTPEYLKEVGLLDQVPPASSDIGYLLRQAMDKIAFLPFGLMIDKWRWEVFSGEVTPAQYNKAWWDLKAKYQGVAPPVGRSEADFDPGAKYHIASNTPYARYFLARILQFQFHRALCQAAGQTGPLHRCSIYKNKVAGERLNKMLSMGKSKPWPDALEAISGQRQMDATAILDYFAPLKKWLDEQNQGETPGWQGMDKPTQTTSAPPDMSERDTVLAKMSQSAPGFKSAQGDFEFETYSKLADDKDLQQGHIYFRRSEKGVDVAFNIMGKVSKQVVYEKGLIRIYDPRINQITERDVSKNKSDVEAFLSLGFGVRGDDLLHDYGVKMAGWETVNGTRTAKLDLTPKNEKMRQTYQKIVLWVDPERDLLLQQQFFEPSGDYRLARYTNIRLNGNLSDDAFRLKTAAKPTIVRP